MALRFYRRVPLLPGVGINLSKSGPSISVGVRGAHVTFGRQGITRTVGLPGTGIYYTSRSGHHSGVHSGLGDQGSSLTPLMIGLLIVVGLIYLGLGPH